MTERCADCIFYEPHTEHKGMCMLWAQERACADSCDQFTPHSQHSTNSAGAVSPAATRYRRKGRASAHRRPPRQYESTVKDRETRVIEENTQ